MNKQMKQLLETVVSALVEGDSPTAKEAFHEYLRLKSQDLLIGESVESEEDSDDKKKKSDESDDDKDGDDDKKDKKDDDADDKKKKKSEEDCEM